MSGLATYEIAGFVTLACGVRSDVVLAGSGVRRGAKLAGQDVRHGVQCGGARRRSKSRYSAATLKGWLGC